MANLLLPLIRQRFFDQNGAPLAGGLLYSYVANTATPFATYTDASGSTPNSNPIVLDSDGYCDVYIGGGAYKFTLKTSAGVDLWTRDNITSVAGESATTAWISSTITDGQAATDLLGATLDISKYSSGLFDLEITRGTTVFVNGSLAIQNVNGTPTLGLGTFIASLASGVTFTISQTGNIVQLRAACSSGPGSGKIKLSRTLVPI